MKPMRDMSDLPDDKLHTGHRSRMRRKFLTYGPRIFDTYEILEMILYYAIPYKDTNPIAKRLLMKFGTLEGVLSASAEELSEVSGIGGAAAELLVKFRDIMDALWLDTPAGTTVYNDYDRAGRRMAEYFRDNKKRSVAIMLLDNGMRERDIVTLYDDVLYGSAAVKAAPFISQALLSGASVVITAHNRPYGPAVVIDSDMETNKMIDQALEQVGVAVAEHYVISGDDYLGTRERHKFSLSADTELEKFIRSRELAAAREEGENGTRKN